MSAFTISEVLTRNEGSCNACVYSDDHAIPKRFYKVELHLNPSQSSSWRLCREHLRDLMDSCDNALDPPYMRGKRTAKAMKEFAAEIRKKGI